MAISRTVRGVNAGVLSAYRRPRVRRVRESLPRLDELESRTLLSFAFSLGSTLGTAAMPRAVAISDLNGDSLLDLVAADYGADKVSVFLGKGNGTFQLEQRFGVGSGPLSVAVGDFNRDGMPDLISGNAGVTNPSISILLGRGDGTFLPANTIPSNAGFVSVADINADGKADVFVCNQNGPGCYALRGKGDGTFPLYASVPTGREPVSLVVGDFNGDGKLDAATANAGEDNISVSFGDGKGNFRPGAAYSTAAFPVSIAAGDLNDDHILDLVVACESGKAVRIFKGIGDGTFQAINEYDVGVGPRGVALADFNADGKIDFVTANNEAHKLGLRLGNGDLSFGSVQEFATDLNSPLYVAVADFNGDHAIDLVTANADTNSLAVFLNDQVPSLSVNAGQNATALEATPFSLTGSFTDADSASWTATVDYGDRTGVQPLALNPDHSFTLQHTYLLESDYVVTVQVRDNAGNVGSDTLTVSVLNVAPLVNAGPDTAINPGDTFSSSGSFGDPGADLWTGTVDYGDGGGEQPLTLNADKTFALEHVYSAARAYVVTVRVTDDEGDTGIDTVVVGAGTVSPVLFLPGATTLPEGTLLLSVGSFGDPDSNAWTATADYGDGTGTINLSFDSNKSFDLRHTYGDNGHYTITVTITDEHGPAIGQFDVTVTNVAPQLTTVVSSATECGAAGPVVFVTAYFTDPGVLDTDTARFIWDDGSISDAVLFQNGISWSASGSHSYATGGRYDIALQIFDDDHALASDTMTARLAGAGLSGGGVLNIVGTAGDDRVTVSQSKGGVIKVSGGLFGASKSQSFPANGIRSIAATMCDGNDRLTISPSVAITAVLDGGSGNDQIKAGGAAAIMLGRDGNDSLTGSNRRDLLIGGAGADKLAGLGDDDLLIAGGTSYETDIAQLDFLLAEWTSTRSIGSRIANLRGTGAGIDFASRSNQFQFLKVSGAGANAFDDAAIDQLAGGLGSDWYLTRNSTGIVGTRDKLTDKLATEIIDELTKLAV